MGSIPAGSTNSTKFIMASLEEQYESYLKKNPQSNLTLEEWKLEALHKLSLFLDSLEYDSELKVWDSTLMDGIEDEPYVSDDFQIGPDGAYEDVERPMNYPEISETISKRLSGISYPNGDISDLGNELGIALGSHFVNLSEIEISMLVSGLRHGISLTNETH